MAIPRVTLSLVQGALGIPPEQTDNVIYFLGHCTVGTVGLIYSFDQATPTDVKSQLGVGKLAQAVASVLRTPKHGPVCAIPCTATTAGSNTAVTATGTSPPAVTLTGAPNDDFAGIVQILSAGNRGTATFRYSLDGGVTWSAEITTAATFLLVYPDGTTSTGVTLNFATGTAYAIDNLYKWNSTAPLCTNTDVGTGFDLLIASGNDLGWVHVLAADQGTLDTDRTTAMASRFAAVSAKLDSLETAYKYAGCSIEAPTPVDPTTPSGLTTWRAALTGAAPALVHKRMMICAGYGRMVSDLDGLSYRRSIALDVVARISWVPIKEHLGKVRSGAVRAVRTSIEHDEEVTGGLDSFRYTTMRTLAGRPGFWITRGQMFDNPGGDYQRVMNLRVINRASKIGRNALLTYLNDDLILDKIKGTLRADEADAIDVDLSTQLASGLGDNCSSSVAHVGRNDNIIATSTISGEFAVQPVGYPEFINFKIGMAKTLA